MGSVFLLLDAECVDGSRDEHEQGQGEMEQIHLGVN